MSHMSKINVQNCILVFLTLYFVIAFLPLRFYVNESSYIPVGQLVPLFIVATLSPLVRRLRYIKNLDSNIVFIMVLYITVNSIFQMIIDLYNTDAVLGRLRSVSATLLAISFFFCCQIFRYD